MVKKNIDENNKNYERWAALRGWKTGPIASRPFEQQQEMRWRGLLSNQFNINIPVSAITQKQFDLINEQFTLTQEQKREVVKYFSDAFSDDQIDFTLLEILNITK
jgi:hypothetical protein